MQVRTGPRRSARREDRYRQGGMLVKLGYKLGMRIFRIGYMRLSQRIFSSELRPVAWTGEVGVAKWRTCRLPRSCPRAPSHGHQRPFRHYPATTHANRGHAPIRMAVDRRNCIKPLHHLVRCNLKHDYSPILQKTEGSHLWIIIIHFPKPGPSCRACALMEHGCPAGQ